MLLRVSRHRSVLGAVCKRTYRKFIRADLTFALSQSASAAEKHFFVSSNNQSGSLCFFSSPALK